MGQRWMVRNKFQAEQFCKYVMENQNQDLIFEIVKPSRTLNQNSAIHAYCDEVAKVMQARGMDMKTVIKEGVPIEPTMYMVKEYMWRPIQKAVTGCESTTKINTIEVNEVYEHLSRLLAERYSIDVRFGRKN